MIWKVFLTSVRISFNFDGVIKVFGKYPFAKILIADACMCSWDINSLYSVMYLSYVVLKYKRDFME